MKNNYQENINIYKKQVENIYSTNGNNALQPDRQIDRTQEIRRFEVSSNNFIQHKPRLSRRVDLITMAFLAVVIAGTLFVCLNYLQMKSDIVKLERSISSIEKQIEVANIENAALAATIESNVCDLEYLYTVAVGNFGMVYPNNNEVKYYTVDDNSYYRNYSSIN